MKNYPTKLSFAVLATVASIGMSVGLASAANATVTQLIARNGDDSVTASDTTNLVTPSPTPTSDSGSGDSENSVTATTADDSTAEMGTGEGSGDSDHADFMMKIEAAKQKRDAAIAQAKANFDAKVAAIKDTQKRDIASHLGDDMNHINDVRTQADIKRLDTMDDILDRLETRAKADQAKGDNVTAILAKITTIRAKIKTLRTAIQTQQAKAYTVTIHSDTTLGTDFRKVFNQVKSDLTTIRLQIKGVKTDIVGVFHSIQALKHDTDTAGTDASPSPTPTASSDMTSTP